MEETSSGNASQFLTLSLFIMLLAFFIVLNAISSFEQEKIESIRQSLKVSLTGKRAPGIFGQGLRPSMNPSPSRSDGSGSTLEHIEGLFEGQIRTFEAEIDEGRGVMHIRLPTDLFVAAVMAVGQREIEETDIYRADESGNFFLPTLVSLLESDSRGNPYRMDIMYNVPENPAAMHNESPALTMAKTGRLGGLARRLQSAGLGVSQMSIGLQAGPEDVMDLYFRRYEPLNPAGMNVIDLSLEREEADMDASPEEP